MADGVGQGHQGQQVPQAPDHDDGDDVGDEDGPVVLDVLGQAVLLVLGARRGAGQAPGTLGSLGVRHQAAVGCVGCCGRVTFYIICFNLLLGSEVWMYLMYAELNKAAKDATSFCLDHSCKAGSHRSTIKRQGSGAYQM